MDKLQAYAVAKGHASRAGPTQALKETLEALCADEKNVRQTDFWLIVSALSDLLCLNPLFVLQDLKLPLNLSPSRCIHIQVVFVVSGKELYAVSEFFGDVVGLGLGAEHGFYYRWPALRDESSQGVAADTGKTDDSLCSCYLLPLIHPRHQDTPFACVHI